MRYSSGRSRAATRLLGIEGVAVVEVEEDPGGRRLARLVTDDEGAAACPTCGVVSTSVKGHAVTHPRDVPYGEDAVVLEWTKTRWRCRESSCPRGSFTESVPAIPARSRLTCRLRSACGAGIAESFRCVQSGGDFYGVSWPIAHSAFVAHVQEWLAAPPPPVSVLGIDEISRGKRRWARDPATGRWVLVADRWLTGIVDAAGTAGLLAHVEGRTAASVAAWLTGQPQAWREAVTHVAIDLSASYANAIRLALSHAVVVADRFHLVRLANDMLTEVRQHATRELRGRRGRARDPEWANRRRC